MIFFSKFHMKYVMGNRFTYGRNVKIVFPITVNHTMQKLHIGSNSTINGKVEIFGKGSLTIGSKVIISKHSKIITASHDYNDTDELPCSREQIKYNMIIENNVWICTNVTLTGSIIIREGSVIGTGSVCTKSTENLSIYAGNPCKKIGDRDRQKFELAKWGWEYEEKE